MDQATKIHSDTVKLITLGTASCERGDAEHNLNAYNVLKNGLERLSEGAPVKGDHVLKCLSLFRIIVKLHHRILSSKTIKKNIIPDIYKPASTINDLLVKSANDAINSGDREYLTEQCEVLLSVSNIIRYKDDIRRLGILEAKLKNAIGELRAKADIVSVFRDEDREIFDNLIDKVEGILKQGDLEQIGITLLKLETLADKLKNKYITSLSFINYIRNYKNNYISKVRKTIDNYVISVDEANLYDKIELIENFSLLEDMEVYHQDHNITLRIKKLKRKINTYCIVPLENKLKEIIEFITGLYNNPYWVEYEIIYEDKYDESEVFTDTFYEYTLKGLPSKKVADLLMRKINKLKQLDLEKLSHINFEEKLIKKLNSVIATFTDSTAKLSPKK
ncbi:MAG: hypothetical protein GY707_07210 [Desulfobacteraceae bacterium]|nr:hypothetical protein [Desulfobacteraceae bacterium]